MKSIAVRTFHLRSWTVVWLLLFALAILVGMIWRNLERFETVRSYVSYSHRILQTGLDLQDAVLALLEPGPPPREPEKLHAIAADLSGLLRLDAHLDGDTPRKLHAVGLHLSNLHRSDNLDDYQEHLLMAMKVMSEMLDAETNRREELLEEISHDTLMEIALTGITLATLLPVAWTFLRRRVLNPLSDLQVLLQGIVQEDMTPIATRDLDPMLQPVFSSYNDMVKHLVELEEIQRRHAASLEDEVRTATQALLEQQRSLAQTERLAALGELTAGIAHELRNPLAGIQLTCVNLREELEDEALRQRLDLVVNELQRMARLLNDLLHQGRASPEPAQDCDIVRLIHDMLGLARYQIRPDIELTVASGPTLWARLPAGHLRQALLNLILNAAQAVGPQAGRITLSAGMEASWIAIRVSDSGAGFPSELLQGGIRPFSTGRPDGTGLGLSMVQRFAREMGGQLRLQNSEQGGAIATLLLPSHLKRNADL